jgi:hypothetical protein
MPSLLRRLHREHLERQQRLTARAVPDAGIRMHNGRPVAGGVAGGVPGLVHVSGPVSGRFVLWQFPFAVAVFKLEFALGKPLTIEQIVREVCAYYKIPRVNLLSQRRYERFTRPRQVAMYLARELTVQSFPMIARALGGRDHTTVMHGARTIAAQLDHDADLITEVRALKQRLGAA